MFMCRENKMMKLNDKINILCMIIGCTCEVCNVLNSCVNTVLAPANKVIFN